MARVHSSEAPLRKSTPGLEGLTSGRVGGFFLPGEEVAGLSRARLQSLTAVPAFNHADLLSAARLTRPSLALVSQAGPLQSLGLRATGGATQLQFSQFLDISTVAARTPVAPFRNGLATPLAEQLAE